MPRAFRQFGLRTLLISLTLLGIALGIWRGVVGPIDRQHAAAAKLTEKGAGIEWAVRGPDWLRKWAGDYYVTEVVEVDLHHQKITDDDLAPLRHFRSLERLYLAGNPIGDTGLRHLSELKHLRRLALWNTKITDAGLAYLAGLESLYGLDIKNTRVTEEGFVHLRDLSKLNYLTHEIIVGDAGLKHLAQLPSLQTGELRCQGLTADGFAHLRQLRGLAELEIISPKAEGWVSLLRFDRQLGRLTVRKATMTDEELAQVMSHNVLRLLKLDRVPVTDAALPAIVASAELNRLSLRQTRVTPEAFLRHLGPFAASVVVTKSFFSLVNTEPKPGHFSWYGDVKPSDFAGLRHCGAAGLVRISGKGIQDADLNVLRELPDLEHVQIHYPLDDADVHVLAKLPNIKALWLAGRQDFTSAGLASLRKVKTLELLDLYETPLSDDQWSAVGFLRQLTELAILGSPLSNEATVHFKGLHQLEKLSVGNCDQVDNETLRHISSLRRLRELHLHDVAVGDPGLRHLHGMSHLKLVTLVNTNCTSTGVQELNATLSEDSEISSYP